MKYITSRELAEKWGVSQRRIVCMAKEGKIKGAVLYGRSWMFPWDISKPLDGRTKNGRKQDSCIFRYPSFEFRDLSSFNPPLTEDELIIKNAQEAFYACNFRGCYKILGDLHKKEGNIYIRICALHLRCMSDMTLGYASDFFDSYGKLRVLLQDDFPHKEEMKEYLYELNATLGDVDYYAKKLRVFPDYPYHESFIPRLCNLSSVFLTNSNKAISAENLRPYELCCILLENQSAYTDLQEMHLSLGVAYGMIGMHEEMTIHMKKALDIAYNYGIYYSLITQYYYTKNFFKEALKEYPKEFKDKITKLSNSTNRQYMNFMEKIEKNSIQKLLSQGDYIYLYYAVQGLSNKEIAGLMHTTAGNIRKRYSNMYALLGVKSKRELLKLYYDLTSKEILG